MSKKQIEFTLIKNARTLMIRKDGSLYVQLKWNKRMDGDLEQFVGKPIVVPTGIEHPAYVAGFVSDSRPCGIILTDWSIYR